MTLERSHGFLIKGFVKKLYAENRHPSCAHARTFRAIARGVMTFTGASAEDMRGEIPAHDIYTPRLLAIYLAEMEYHLPESEICRFFYCNQTDINMAHDRIGGHRWNPNYDRDIRGLKYAIDSRLAAHSQRAAIMKGI